VKTFRQLIYLYHITKTRQIYYGFMATLCDIVWKFGAHSLAFQGYCEEGIPDPALIVKCFPYDAQIIAGIFVLPQEFADL
jgi:hypothetical protein